ncbi:MAG: capsule assembly Wzi family protein [Bacteroidia bacterium]
MQTTNHFLFGQIGFFDFFQPMKRLILLSFCCLSFVFNYAQNTDIILGHDLYHYVDRLDIKGIMGIYLPTEVKPYGRNDLAEWLANADTSQFSGNELSWHYRMRFLADDSLAFQDYKPGVFKRFYRNRRDLFYVKTPTFQMAVNPSVHFAGGMDRNDFSGNVNDLLTYTNSRGLSLRGSFIDKIGFYTEVYDNVIRAPQFVFNHFDQNQVLPGEAFIKRFGDENGLDFFSSRAYITYRPWKQMRIKFGKDRAFWGNGYQSLLLSDNAADYLLLNIQTRIWKLVYTNHFTQMIHFVPDRNDTEGTLPRKYGVFHQLTWAPQSNLSFSIFESVIYSPILANGQRGFELQYLNPLIFYRAAEQYIGSPDNGMLGLQTKWNFLQRFQLYGQVLLDDYNYSRRNDGKGYWGNKLGLQVGGKYIDAFGISTLDLQAEYNRIRPYTYQHFSRMSNYTHYRQPIGHALGANLQDFRLFVRYHPVPPLQILLSYHALVQGRDGADGINYGGDPQIPQINRPGEFENIIGQGEKWQLNQFYGRFSWQLFRSDIFLELETRYRTEAEKQSFSVLGGIRAGILPREIKY